MNTTDAFPINMKPLRDIDSMDGYFGSYGSMLGRKAIDALAPLHIPDRDPLPDFSHLARPLFPCQQHAVAAIREMLGNSGSGFLCGEMGTGKTFMGIAGVNIHALQSRNDGGKGGRYRALVLCPDHLVDKWCREIKSKALPDAVVQRFGRPGDGVEDEDETQPVKGKRKKNGAKTESGTRRTLRDFAALMNHGYIPRGGKPGRKTWKKPKGAEWYVLGRNQAKWLSKWIGLADRGSRFGGRQSFSCMSSKTVVVDIVNEKNEFGRDVASKLVYGKAFCCPKCGTVIKDKKGVPVGEKNLSSSTKGVTQKSCQATYAQEIATESRAKNEGMDRLSPVPDRFASKRPADRKSGRPADEFTMGGRRYRVMSCDEPLYNYTNRPMRWSPARITQKKLRKFFDYLVVDEVHEQKSDEAARSMACGKLIASVDHVLALTGTLIGGYADHLYPLMMRITPKSLREEGFEWGKSLEFSKTYGRIDTVVKVKEDSDVAIGGNVGSMRKARTGNRSAKTVVRPGIMPTMFGRHLVGSSIFVSLSELAENLPDLFEYVGGPMPPAPVRSQFDAAGRSDEDADGMFEYALDMHERAEAGWIDCAVDMLPDQKAEYNRIKGALEAANTDLLQRGSMKLLGTYLRATTDYPDMPFGWGHSKEVKKAIKGSEDENEAPGLLGQSFLGNFEHTFVSATGTLILSRARWGETETDRLQLRKEGGIYWVDVTFNGKVTKSLAYDTGASSVSIPEAMAAEIGLKTTGEGLTQIADGSVVPVKKSEATITVGKFTIDNVECTIVPPKNQPHTLGYWNLPDSKKIENWVGVVTPNDLPEKTIYPKEQALIDICKKQKEDGTQTWVYVNMTAKRDIQPRLKRLLEAEGLKVGILRSKEVEPTEREAWIAKNGKVYDVIISHPELVSTGLDLFDSDTGGHNFSTLVFYETGYSTFTLMQASRRAWRIGQPRDCRVYYLYYRDTMQERAMSLISRKLSATKSLEGNFSEEGLAAMAGEDNAQMALAKHMSEQIDDKDMQRSWVKVDSGSKKVLKRPTDAIKEMPVEAEPSKFDDLPEGLQLVAESIVESEAFKAKAVAAYEFDDDDDDEFVPEGLSQEAMLKMFQQMDANSGWDE